MAKRYFGVEEIVTMSVINIQPLSVYDVKTLVVKYESDTRNLHLG